MSSKEQIILDIVRKYFTNSSINSELVRFIISLEGSQFFVEKVDESVENHQSVLRTFSTVMSISIEGRDFGRNYVDEVFDDVPSEIKIDAMCIGDIYCFEPREAHSKYPDSIQWQRSLGVSASGSLFIGSNGSIWAYIEDYTYCIAQSFSEFLLISPKDHYQLNYPLKF